MSPRSCGFFYFSDKILLPAEIEKSENVVTISVFDFADESEWVLEVSDCVTPKHRADDSHIYQSARRKGHIDPSHVKNIRAVVHKSRWVSELSTFLVAEKSRSVKYRVQPSLLVNGKPAVSLYLIYSCYRPAMGQTFDDSKID